MTEKLLLDINDSIGRIELIMLQQKGKSSSPTQTVDSSTINANSKSKNSKKTGIESLDPATYDSVAGMLTAMSKVKDTNASAIGNITDTLSKLTDVIKDVDITKIDSVSSTMSSISSALLGFGFKLTLATPLLMTSRLALPIAESIIKSLSSLPNISKDLSGTEKLLTDVSSITSSLFKVGATLTLLAPLMITSVPGLLMATTVVLPLLSLMAITSVENHSKFQGMQQSMKDLSIGLLYLTGTFMLLSVASEYVPVTPTAIITGFGLLLLSAGAMSLIGMLPENSIERGASVVKQISISMLIFGGSMAILSLVGEMIVESASGVAVGLSMMVLSGLAFAGVGLLAPQIKQGSFAVAVMGLSLLVFSASLVLSSAIIQAMPDGTASGLLGVGLALITFGAIFALAGLVSSQILQGSLSVGLMSLSLLVFGFTLGYLNEKWADVPTDFLWQFPLFLFGVGAVFALAGYASPLIMSGALAFGLIGASLWVIGKGIESIVSVADTDPMAMDNIGYLLKSMVNGVSGAFSDLGIKDAVLLPGKLTALVGMAGSMWLLAKGIRAWKDMNLSPTVIQTLQSNMTAVLSTIPSVFAQIGKLDAGGSIKQTSVLSILGITDGFSKGDVERGINATMKLGKNLTELSKGITAWKTMKIAPAELMAIRNNLVAVLSTIPSAFADIGKLEAGGRIKQTTVLSILGITEGFSKGDVERGIDSVSKLGDTLSSLSKGVEDWKSMKVSEQDIQAINTNIQAVLLTIPSAFAEIGKLESGSQFYSPSVLSVLGFTDGFSKGHIEQGISLVSDLSGTLTKLKDSILVWNDPKLSPTNLKPALESITTLLGILPTAFATIGRANEDSKSTIGMFGLETTIGDGDIDRGVELVTELLHPLTKVANIIKVLSSISSNPKDTIFGVGYGTYAFMHFTNKGLRLISKDTVTKLNSIVSPLERLAKIFDKLNKGLKTHRDYLKGIDPATLKTWESWITVLDKVSKVDTAKLVETVTASVNYSRALAQTPPDSIGTVITPPAVKQESEGNIVSRTIDGITNTFKNLFGGGDKPTPKTTPATSSTSTSRTVTSGGMDTATAQALLSAIEKLNSILEKKNSL